MNDLDPQAYHELFTQRTRLLFESEDFARLQEATVLVAGCGGVGGMTLVTLARLGIGSFVLADPGAFDEPDVNRQYAATRSSLGRNKAEVYGELVADINPCATVELHPEGVTATNFEELIGAADIVIDGLDFNLRLELRLNFYRRCQALGRWCLSGPLFGFGALLLAAAPYGMGMDGLIAHFVKVARNRSKLPRGFADRFFADHIGAVERNIPGAIPSCSIAANFTAGLQATEIALQLVGQRHPDWRAPLRLPEVLVCEPLAQRLEVLHYRKLFPDYEG